MTTLAAGLATIVSELWSDVLMLPLLRAEGITDGNVDQEKPMMTCFVEIDGAWNGAVVLTCSSTLADRLAASMLDVSVPDPHDARDALGEITNIIAGNVKALLPHPCTMSLPVVTAGHDRSDALANAPVVARLAFRSDGQDFTVSAFGSAADLELP